MRKFNGDKAMTCKECFHYEACKTMLEAMGYVVDGEGEYASLVCNEFQAAADVVEVVRCGDCIHFMPKHILLDDGTRRPYTEEEKKLPLGVTGDVGINCGSRCLRERAWENNRVPVYVQETDFCSYGERRGE